MVLPSGTRWIAYEMVAHGAVGSRCATAGRSSVATQKVACARTGAAPASIASATTDAT